MTQLRYSIEAYKIRIRMTRSKILLVEGKDDRYLFERYIEATSADSQHRDFQIDTAEIVNSPSETRLGNREKVEYICNSLSGTQWASKLVGFVDREFRSFQLDPAIRDDIVGHHIDAGLIWSRGHSIENYWFDIQTLRSPLVECCTSAHLTDGVDLFSRVFSDALKIACSVALALRELDALGFGAKSVGWKELVLEKECLKLDLAKWRSSLMNRMRADPRTIEQVCTAYDRWLTKVKLADEDSVRWLCHGHVGLWVLWSAFARCMF